MHQNPTRRPTGNQIRNSTPTPQHVGEALGAGTPGSALDDLAEKGLYGLDKVLGVVAHRGLAFGWTDVHQPVLAKINQHQQNSGRYFAL